MSSAASGLNFRAQVVAGRDEAAQKVGRQVTLGEYLSSLWTPLGVLAAFMLLYIVVVELAPDAVSWAMPTMRAVGLFCFVWWAGLCIGRLVLPGRQIRRLRHDYRELLGQIENRLEKNGVGAESPTRLSLLEKARAFDQRSLASDAPGMEQALEALSKESASLSGWKDSNTFEFIWGLLKWLAIALLIRSVVFEPFKIPSGSMIPTLQIGDHIFVNKFIYGVRIPFINYVPFQIVRAPKAGDVIVFNNPAEPDRDYIKRVVAVGGDVVEIIDEVLHVNGVPQPRELVSEQYLVNDQDYLTGEWSQHWRTLYMETLAGQPHPILQARPTPKEHRDPAHRVEEGHVFVMGDNRDNSLDSRFGLGAPEGGVKTVPLGHIKGKAMVIWLALGHGGLGSGLFGGTGLRVDRLFTPVR